jgi:hypothetical protein
MVAVLPEAIRRVIKPADTCDESRIACTGAGRTQLVAVAVACDKTKLIHAVCP